MKKLSLLACLALLVFKVQGQAGKLDPSFGGKGYISTLVGTGNGRPSNFLSFVGKKVLTQQDGKFLLMITGFGTQIARFKADGTVDESYGEKGYTAAEGSVVLRNGALQADDKLVLAGDSVVQRFNLDGSPDHTFGTAGRLNIHTGAPFYAYAVAVQNDGKILIAGTAYTGANGGEGYNKRQFSLLRYNPDGQPDAGFGNGGQVITPSGYDRSEFRQIVLQSNGKIIAAGNASAGTNPPDLLLVQYNANGSPDASFGTAGFVNSNIHLAYEPIFHLGSNEASLALQGDGKILLGGTSVIQRYTATGARDNTFFTIGTDMNLGSIVVQPDGMIVAGGTHQCCYNRYTGTYTYMFQVSRYTANGQAGDNSFNGSGVVYATIGGPQNSIWSLTLLPNGQIVAAGSTSYSSDYYYTPNDYALLRLDATGKSLGQRSGFPPTYHCGLEGVAVQPDGKVVAAGWGYIHRFNQDGSPDNSFGNAGSVAAGDNTYTHKGIASVKILPEGKILYKGTGNADALRQFNADGSPDNAFNGFTGLPVGDPSDYNSLIAVQADGKILAAQVSAENNFTALARYKANGSPDSSFQGTGVITTPFWGTSNMRINAIATQPDGKIVVAGSASDGTKTNFALARFNPDGSPDPGFNGSGVVLTSFGDNSSEALHVTIQPDGRMFAAGQVSLINGNYLGLAYYSADGKPDNSMGTAGLFTSGIQLTPPYRRISQIIQAGEKFVVAASSFNGKNTDVLLARFHKNGSLDSSFGNNGRITADFGREDLTPAIAVSDNRLYLAETDNTTDPLTVDNKGILAAYLPEAAAPPLPPVTNGLTYRFYQGSWTSLPDFSTLTPVKTGTTPNVDINVRPAGVNTNYAFVWEGYITIPAPGDYTFESFSDDGSRFYFNTLYAPGATALVDHDGEHYPYSKQQTIHIDAAGRYPVALTYFQKEGDAAMQLYWSGPGFARQLVPDAAFSSNYQPPVSNGLQYRYFEGVWTSLPDFTTLTPVKTGVTHNTDISVRSAGVNTNYAFLWEGYIKLPAPGDYTLESFSDDGSKVYFNTPYSPGATALIDHDGEHYPYAKTGTLHVDAAGLYPIAVTYFQKEGDAAMQLYWTGPGFARQPVPDSAFVHAAMSNTINSTQSFGTQLAAADGAPLPRAKLYPNPFNNRLNIDLVNPAAQSTIAVDLYDITGKKVYSQLFENRPLGLNTLQVTLQGNKLPAGVYHAQVRVNGIPVASLKLMKAAR